MTSQLNESWKREALDWACLLGIFVRRGIEGSARGKRFRSAYKIDTFKIRVRRGKLSLTTRKDNADFSFFYYTDGLGLARAREKEGRKATMRGAH